MNLKPLKVATTRLPRIDHLVENFEKHWIRPVRKGTKRHSFLHDLSNETKKELNVQLRQMQQSLQEIKYGQVLNDKLATLAHHLVDLKLASVMDDHKKANRIVKTFLRDPHTRLKQVMFEIPYLESQLALFKQSYHSILDRLSKELPLEHATMLLHGEHGNALKQLMVVSQEQKKHLSHIGRHFVQMTKELKEKKEFKNHFR